MKTKSDGEEAEPAGYEGMEAFARAIEIGIVQIFTIVQPLKVHKL